MVEADGGEIPFLRARCNNTTSSLFFLDHEADESKNNGLNIPKRIPSLRMIIAHAHADAFVYLEATVRRTHFDAWRLQGVLFWDYYSTKIVTVFIWAVF